MADGEPSALIGRTIAGKFLVEERVGSGAMGDVYRARHTTLDTVIAIKIMRPDLAKDEMFRERFYREAKAASKLEHVNSVRVIDYGHDNDGLIYLAMEFLGGRDLLTVLREDWPLSDERIVSIVSQALAAVSVAHDLGIIHRDLKPENIMVAHNPDELAQHKDTVKVCDFGIAKLNDPRAFQTEGGSGGKPLTTTGTLIGTPEYMSPEQARGDPLDARSDVYSVGVILYQMLTGKVPFTAENMLGVVLKHVTDEPAPPSSVRPGIHGRLEAICLRALRKKREDRYQSAKEMRADLKKALGSDPRLQFDSQPDVSTAASVVVRPTGTLVTGDRATMPVDSRSDRPRIVGYRDSAPDFTPKQTSDGTELNVPMQPRSRMTMGVVVALIALVVGAGSVVLYTKRLAATDPGPVASASGAHPRKGRTPRSGAAKHGAPAHAPSSSAGATHVPTSDPPPAAAGALTAAATAGGAHPTVRNAASASPTTKPPASAAASASASASPSATPSAAASVIPPAPTAPVAPRPPYDPSRAYVEMGMLNVTGVQRAAVHGRMRQLQPTLSGCYRQGLAKAGSAVGGTPTIHLSIDASGRLQPTITGADRALAPAVYCMQRAIAGQSVGAAAVTAPGATAEQWLTLHP